VNFFFFRRLILNAEFLSIFMFKRRSDLKVFNYVLLMYTKILESLSNIERFAARSPFLLFFFNHGAMSSIKVSREQIETFFFYYS